jgi:isoquinoline 1-oxidoreductase beta subunit
MEPHACIARVGASDCEIWSGTQNITRSTTMVAEMLALPADKVTVHTAPLGGSFGRRIGYDLEVRAVEIARAAGDTPVKIIWSREEDTTHDHYRPAVAAHFAASLGADGAPEALEVKVASQPFIVAKKSRSTIRPDGVDTGIMGALDELVYDIPNLRLAYVATTSPIPAGTWRSVPRSYNTFIVESLIDELAHGAGKDPYTYRRSLIKNDPRVLAVLDKAAEASAWGTPLPQGHGRGIAAWSGYDSCIAQVVEVAVEAGQLRVLKVVNAVDCGLVINPDIVVQQMEGGMLQGLTAALRNEITVENGAVEQSNFHDYQLLLLSEVPIIETHIVASDSPPGGIGEVATPAVQAALTNAIYAATGKRIRQLPVSRHDLGAA